MTIRAGDTYSAVTTYRICPGMALESCKELRQEKLPLPEVTKWPPHSLHNSSFIRGAQRQAVTPTWRSGFEYPAHRTSLWHLFAAPHGPDGFAPVARVLTAVGFTREDLDAVVKLSLLEAPVSFWLHSPDSV